MSILVTGGTGVVGSHLVRELVRHGERPVVLDALLPKRFERELGAHVEFESGDIRDAQRVLDLCRHYEVSTVVHLAALTGSRSLDEPMAQFSVNMVGTMNVLEAARSAGVRRVLMASTRTVLPDFEETSSDQAGYLPITEEHWCDPRRPYETWKFAAERIGAEYRTRFGLEVASFRFAIYLAPERVEATSPGPKRTMSLLHAILHRAATGTPVDLASGADRLLDLVYVRDIARALRLAATCPSLPSCVYNVGGGSPVTVREFTEFVCRAQPKARVTVGPGTDFATGHYCLLSIERAREELGFEPEWSPEAAIADCLAVTRGHLDRHLER